MSTEQRFADYVLFEKLSSTAFGDCFRAGQLLGSVVESHVLLQLFNGTSLEGDSFWQLVADRCSLLENLRDPHLGDSSAFGQVQATAFTAYSYTPGSSLDRFFTAVRDQKLPVPIDQALFIIERVALGLTAAHQVSHRGRPVLHGFLVPELIRLSSEGEIRVLGIEAAPGLRSQLAAHPAFGSYLAPEVRKGEAPTETDDVYSLGALLFHLLCGVALPPDSKEPVAAIIDGATLAAGGESLPPVIGNLLKNSLAPSASRIPDAVTWQQVLGKIILDGEHNPTTFNLSFLMHTVFRQDLEVEMAKIPQELARRFSPSAPLQAVEPAEPTDLPTADDELVPDLAGLPIEQSPRPFLAGFMVSFLAAIVFISSYFVFFHTPGEADTGGMDLSPVAMTGSLPAPVTSRDASNLDDPALSGDLEVSSASSLIEPSATPDQAQPSVPVTEDEVQTLVATRTEDIEASLRAEYEERLLELESRLAASTGPVPSDDSVELTLPRILTDLSENVATVDNGPVAEEPAASPGSTASQARAETLQLADSQTQSVQTAGSLPPEIPSEVGDARDPAGTGNDLETAASLEREPVETVSSVVFQPPRLESPPRPKYPAAARRLRQAATVQVRVLVDASGNVSETELAGPPAGLGFDSAAEAAAKRSRWVPATRDGKPVDSWAVLKIEFQP